MKGRNLGLRIWVVLAVAAFALVSLTVGGGTAWATEPNQPPLAPLPPPASTVEPPCVAATWECSNWYLTNTYGARWATSAPAWWEKAGGTGGAYYWSPDMDYYFYWDGSKPVRYGTWTYPFYDLDFDVLEPCAYWFDNLTYRRFGPYDAYGPSPCTANT